MTGEPTALCTQVYQLSSEKVASMRNTDIMRKH